MSEWDEYASTWDTNEDVKLYSEKAFASLKKHLNIENAKWKNAHVLDFGCGTGCLTEKIASIVKKVVAIDSSAKMIQVLKQKGIKNIWAESAELSSQYIQSNTVYNEKFDLIMASSVCGFLPDFTETLRLLESLLKPNAVFIQWDWESTGKADDIGLSRENILDAYKQTGLEILHLEKEFSLTGDGNEMPVLMGIAKLGVA